MARLVVMLVLAVAAGCPGPAPVTAPPRARSPRLVVLVVIDQLPAWAFDRDRALFTRGLGRLLRDGASVRAAELPYAHPFTAPGHASIATGAPPSVHGVIGNSWYRRADGRERPAEFDPAATVFPVGPSHGGALSTDDGVSARALRVDGIADALRRAEPGARSVAIALKPRAAAFVAGRRPDLAIWYEAAAGVTRRPGGAGVLAATTGITDDAPGEGSTHGLDASFPHELARSDRPQRAFLHTPYADEIVFDAAVAALEAMQLGDDDVADLLALSFNARDYAGHLWGADSWEALELTLRLDARLGDLFDLLDRKLGKDGWAAVLTSDHGATRVVERGTIAGARRVRTTEIREAAEAVLGARLGGGPWIASVGAGNLYLSAAFSQQPADARAGAVTAAAAAIAKLPGIAAAGPVEQDAGRCDTRSGIARAICMSLVDGVSGELYVVPTAGSSISDYTTGTAHDAPFDDNRRVPILVLAPGLAAQTGEGSVLQVAPTLAALLRIAPPPAATEAPLFLRTGIDDEDAGRRRSLGAGAADR